MRSLTISPSSRPWLRSILHPYRADTFISSPTRLMGRFAELANAETSYIPRLARYLVNVPAREDGERLLAPPEKPREHPT